MVQCKHLSGHRDVDDYTDAVLMDKLDICAFKDTGFNIKLCSGGVRISTGCVNRSWLQWRRFFHRAVAVISSVKIACFPATTISEKDIDSQNLLLLACRST